MHTISTTFATLSVLILCVTLTLAQDTAPTLAEILTPGVENGSVNEPFRLLFPTAIITSQTPIAIRATFVFALVRHEVNAACDPVMLSFFGTQDNIAPRFCSADGQAVIRSYIYNRVYASQFPPQAPAFARFLVRVGLFPFVQSRDTSTRIGWANVAADRLLSFLENDGWNSVGNENRRDFLQAYADFSGYRPRNHPLLRADKLRNPLRWQPLTGPEDNLGNFASQVHVVPHIGISGEPLTLTEEDFRSRTVGSPYSRPNRAGSISLPDTRVMRQQLDDLLRINRRISPKQIALAFWWDNKFTSVGNFAGFYSVVFGLGRPVFERLFFAETMAQYDAVLLAWKEKRRHDLVRPTTMIRRFFRGQRIMAFRGFGKGVGMVRAKDWEPIVPIQPHSEFPSASAVICRATLELLQLSLEQDIVGNQTIPPFTTTINPGSVPGSPVDRAVNVTFNTLEEAWRNCGFSRLNAGVHFGPSVPAGFQLARGLAAKVKEHTDALFSGTVPEVCARCNRAPIE